MSGRKRWHHKHGGRRHHSKRAWDVDDDLLTPPPPSEIEREARARAFQIMAEQYVAMTNGRLSVLDRDPENFESEPKPRAPRKKKTPPLPSIEEAAVAPTRKIRIIR